MIHEHQFNEQDTSTLLSFQIKGCEILKFHGISILCKSYFFWVGLLYASLLDFTWHQQITIYNYMPL